jgi:hypothetical protein
VKPEVGDQKVVHGAAQIIVSALASSRVPMQVFNRATEFLADVRQRHAMTVLPRRVCRAIGVQWKIVGSL